MNRLMVVCGLSLLMAFSSAAELPTGSHWIKAGLGQVPAGAIALGRGADGREQYACRAQQGKGTYLGSISVGSGGCGISFGGRELTLSNYEVLSAGAIPALQAVNRLNRNSGNLVGRAEVVPSKPNVTGLAPTIDASGTVHRGFDEAGQPYIEEHKADGTVVRKLPNEIQVTHPDGKRDLIPQQQVLSNAPAPTPPELPADPQRGRVWLNQHNAALLDVISKLVRGNESEMQKFSTAERKEAGDDVFRQIVFRTRTAGFLATAN